MDRLAAAARRGVDVTLIVPQANNSVLAKLATRGRYSDLLAAGIKVYEYVGADPSTPRMSHGKVAVFDDRMATVGSSNLDARSLVFNNEANIWIDNPAFATTVVRDLFTVDIGRSQRIETHDPGPWRRAVEKLAGWISFML
jgi:cardiolipin synthase